MLGVAFMAGTLVLTDTIGKTFDDLFADVNAGTDAYVRGEQSIESDFGDVRARIPAALVTTSADASTAWRPPRARAGLRADRRQATATRSATRAGRAHVRRQLDRRSRAQPVHARRGRGRPPPTTRSSSTRAAPTNGDFAVGDRVTVLTEGSADEFTIVGIAKFGDADSPGGASFVVVRRPRPRSGCSREPGSSTPSAVAEQGVSQEELAATDRGGAATDGIEVLTGRGDHRGEPERHPGGARASSTSSC